MIMIYEIVLIVFQLFIGVQNTSEQVPFTAQACTGDMLSMSCPQEYFIEIKGAAFGKSSAANCPDPSEDTCCPKIEDDCRMSWELHHLRAAWDLCSGQQNCTMQVKEIEIMPHLGRQCTNSVTSDYARVLYICNQKSSLANICDNVSREMSVVNLVSPGYPAEVSGQNYSCECLLTPPRKHGFIFTRKDYKEAQTCSQDSYLIFYDQDDAIKIPAISCNDLRAVTTQLIEDITTVHAKFRSPIQYNGGRFWVQLQVNRRTTIEDKITVRCGTQINPTTTEFIPTAATMVITRDPSTQVTMATQGIKTVHSTSVTPTYSESSPGQPVSDALLGGIIGGSILLIIIIVIIIIVIVCFRRKQRKNQTYNSTNHTEDEHTYAEIGESMKNKSQSKNIPNEQIPLKTLYSSPYEDVDDKNSEVKYDYANTETVKEKNKTNHSVPLEYNFPYETSGRGDNSVDKQNTSGYSFTYEPVSNDKKSQAGANISEYALPEEPAFDDKKYSIGSDVKPEGEQSQYSYAYASISKEPKGEQDVKLRVPQATRDKVPSDVELIENDVYGE